MSEYSNWVESIAQKARRLSLLFLQLGSAHEPARRALSNSRYKLLSVEEYLKEVSPSSADLLILDRVETLLEKGGAEKLGRLRERVFADLELGSRVVLLSRSPRGAFPATPGSSLLDDASFVQGPALDADRFSLVPACKIDGRDPVATLQASLMELGTEICASLDRAIFEAALVEDAALSVLSARELEALDGAGITRLVASRRTWTFPRHMAELKEALSFVLAGQWAVPSQLSDVSSELWRIERMLRSAIRRRAIAEWGSTWRTQCLNESLSADVLSRACESAYLSASSVKQIRDPLEWLSLGELLSLRDLKQVGNLGMSSQIWRQFSAQVMPIRNRLAHMRALNPGDAADVLKWRTFLEIKLKP